MKVLFVYPNVTAYPKMISIGIAYLSAVLKKHGHETGLIDTTFGMKDAAFLAKVKEFGPDIIAMTSVTSNFPYATHLASLAKKENKVPIVIGGVHATIDPEETLLKDCFDMICIGEGENALLELVASLEEGRRDTSISNIWFKENGRIIKNGLGPLWEDLDTLPYPDLNLYDYHRYLTHNNLYASFMGTRGCPYKCAFCINRTEQKLYKGLGRFVRYRSVDSIIDEIRSVARQYPFEIVSFNDDTFTLDKARVEELCKKFKREVGLPFCISTRVDTITDEMCQDLSDAGCIRVLIGVESGDPLIRNKVLKKSLTNEQIIEGSRLIKKHGMELYTFNMIGVPGERMHNVKATIALNRKIEPDFLITSIFTAFKGTELYEVCKRDGILDETIHIDSFYSSSNVRHPYLSRRKLKRLAKWFAFSVFIAYDIKKAFIALLDRYAIDYRFYTRLRTTIARKVLHSRKAGEKVS